MEPRYSETGQTTQLQHSNHVETTALSLSPEEKVMYRTRKPYEKFPSIVTFLSFFLSIALSLIIGGAFNSFFLIMILLILFQIVVFSIPVIFNRASMKELWKEDSGMWISPFEHDQVTLATHIKNLTYINTRNENVRYSYFTIPSTEPAWTQVTNLDKLPFTLLVKSDGGIIINVKGKPFTNFYVHRYQPFVIADKQPGKQYISKAFMIGLYPSLVWEMKNPYNYLEDVNKFLD